MLGDMLYQEGVSVRREGAMGYRIRSKTHTIKRRQYFTYGVYLTQRVWADFNRGMDQSRKDVFKESRLYRKETLYNVISAMREILEFSVSFQEALVKIM